MPTSHSKQRVRPSAKHLRECLRYKDGKLFWLVRPRRHFKSDQAHNAWNARYSGKEAGYLSIRKYKHYKPDYRWMLGIDGEERQRYVLIWVIHHGKWPPEKLEIDHKNKNSIDDRIENLRLATHAQNQWNSRVNTNSKSGCKGVTWYKAYKKWSVKVWFRNKPVFVGYFSDLSDAKNAYAKTAQKLFGEFACSE
jgi:hypothetical protein